MRAHIIIPKELVESIDKTVGKGNRSHFLVEAAEDKLRSLRLARVATRVVGSLANANTPGWETPNAVSEWVHRMRRTNDERLEKTRKDTKS
ncbi:MAG: hypothetical protein HYW33_00750 [Candidatus Blackburnbacteria bacterium]|nr:hypothetical protein [Candidatus Blackburnbacteria bacterium]